ncbi:hypothetical protein VP01_961g2 [Puccinia sorghi]|uniref:Uncharacterized protein n=1 Tax=Puccinia sorghi TaxID=27349 RepID=A0A0L6U653_9BASI|nr:hypothetical protein VP01_961g2 [Puccinia sorghi]
MEYIYQNQSLRAQNHLCWQHITCKVFSQFIRWQNQEEKEDALLFVALAFLCGPVQQLRKYLTLGKLEGNPLAGSTWAYWWSPQGDFTVESLQARWELWVSAVAVTDGIVHTEN